MKENGKLLIILLDQSIIVLFLLAVVVLFNIRKIDSGWLVYSTVLERMCKIHSIFE